MGKRMGILHESFQATGNHVRNQGWADNCNFVRQILIVSMMHAKELDCLCQSCLIRRIQRCPNHVDLDLDTSVNGFGPSRFVEGSIVQLVVFG